MWQRIQTLFMLIAAVLMVVHLIIPSGSIEETAIYTLDNILATILSCLAIVLALAAISMFKNRKRQLILNWISTAAIAVLYILWMLGTDRSEETYQVEWGMYLPGFAALFLLLANFRIRKDQNMVDSMDRLR